MVHTRRRTTAPMDVATRLIAVSGEDSAGSHDNPGIEHNFGSQEIAEDYDDELLVHDVGQGGNAGLQVKGGKKQGQGPL